MPAVAARQPPGEADIRAALERVAASAVFSASPRLIAFLRYVVGQALAGECARIKGYTIAVEALGRDAAFDPRADPIVRVEAGRLRRLLERYYGGEDAADPVAIELVKGCYVPVFRWRDALTAPAGSTSADPEAAQLHTALTHMIRLCRLQMQTIVAEIDLVERLLARARELGRPEGDACPPRTRLLPTAPSPQHAAAARSDGREE